MLPRFDPRKWTPSHAAHLLNRAGFGGTPEAVASLYEQGLERAVASLVDGPDDSAQFPKPEWAVPTNLVEQRMEAADLPQEERRKRFQEYQRMQFRNITDLVAWWLERMARTPNPLREKLTLFWHGHFATSIEKVRNAYLMWRQNETLRQLGAGPFPALAKAIARDPAMMIYLDTRDSKRSQPNENFARELMELFTLGIGNYTETDIKEVARAFTGYKLNPADLTFRFAEIQHDDGVKRCLGVSGKFKGEDVIDRIVALPACHRLVAAKLWTYFAGTPDAPLADALAKSFAAAKLATGPYLRELFLSAAFYRPAVMRNQIKSPIQWAVSSAKILGADLPPTLPTINALRQLGQVPFSPPSVKGWDGGHAWITTSTLLTRYNLAGFFVGATGFNVAGGLRGRGNRAGRAVENRRPPDMKDLAPPPLRSDPKKLVAALTARLFQSDLSERETTRFLSYLEEKNRATDDEAVRGLLHLMMSTPEFQLT
jgi:uncharacterized protein (DUF1800 family)